MRLTTTVALTTQDRAALAAYTGVLRNLLGGLATVNAVEVVTAQHLVKRYGNMLAVNDVSFSIHEGETRSDVPGCIRVARTTPFLNSDDTVR